MLAIVTALPLTACQEEYLGENPKEVKAELLDMTKCLLEDFFAVEDGQPVPW